VLCLWFFRFGDRRDFFCGRLLAYKITRKY
jgi:hypothetical protein